MGIPSTIITGTIGYIVLGCLLLGGVFAMQGSGQLSKDNAA
jgi:hypothetical protein